MSSKRPLKAGDKVLYRELPAVVRIIYDNGDACILMHGEQKPGQTVWHIIERIVSLKSLTLRRARYGGDGMLRHAYEDYANIPKE